MVASGHVAAALTLAKSLTITHPPDERVLAEVAIAQAQSGDIAGAVQTMRQLTKDSQGRTGQRTVDALAFDGKFAAAEQLASQIPDRFWKGEAYARNAEAKASKDGVDGAIEAAEKIQNRGNGDQQKVMAALASFPDDSGAGKGAKQGPICPVSGPIPMRSILNAIATKVISITYFRSGNSKFGSRWQWRGPRLIRRPAR